MVTAMTPELEDPECPYKDDNKVDPSLAMAFRWSLLCFRYGFYAVSLGEFLFLALFWLNGASLLLFGGGAVVLLAGLILLVFGCVNTKVQATQCAALSIHLIAVSLLTLGLILSAAILRHVYERIDSTGLDATTNQNLLYFTVLIATASCALFTAVLAACRFGSKRYGG